MIFVIKQLVTVLAIFTTRLIVIAILIFTDI